MTVATIEIAKPGCRMELQTWLDEHPTATLTHVAFVGNFCYIFYV